MGKSQRQKGYRNENNLVHKLNDDGLQAIRVPLSGGTSFAKGDIVLQGKYRIEVKSRQKIQLYDWLKDNDFLFVKGDYKDWLVVMTYDTWLKMFRRCMQDGE